MAQLITVRLSRDGGNPWGFRLQGGKDFGTPLVIQKVNGGSPAEKAGLIAGDSVIKVNTTDVFSLRHKDAQDVIVRAGQTFDMTVQRGGSTWKPAVAPVGSLPRSQPQSNNISPVTKTSLAAKNQDYTPIGTAHNLSPKGFSGSAPAPAPHVNGNGPKLVNKQYNTPIGLYSEQSIAETLSAQSEVLSTGAMGVNFKKNEKNYDAEKSEVYKMLQEAEREPRTPEPVRYDVYSAMSHAIGGRATSPRPITPVPPKPQTRPANVVNETQGNPTCSDCERLIVGVFVRIKDKNLHVECFKCATCGSSLKNVGYYNINNKLYCDVHAKLAARSNPPAPNMVPVTIPPGGKAPVGTISAALASHSLPSPSPLSPSGNQIAAPFSPQPIQDNFERYSPNNNYNPQKVDAVANLVSALTIASQKDYRENCTNTESVFLAEKIIPINNGFNNNNNGIKEEQFQNAPPSVKYMPYRPKSASNFSGPKPFSSVQPATPTHAPFSSVQPSTPGAAPISAPLSNTLPRSGSAATMPERKEWPPSKLDEIPTACPLYIAPSSRTSTPQPRVSNPQLYQNQSQNPVSQNPRPYIPIAQNPIPQITISQNPTSQMISQNVPDHIISQHPPPQNIYHHPPPQIMVTQNPPPAIAINETKMSKSEIEEFNSEYKSTQEVSNKSQNIERNMSICSAEVVNITGRRSVMECVETVSDAIDTQILVNNVTRIKERPKSPPPLPRKDSVYDTQDISIAVSTNTPGGKSSGNPVLTVDDKSNVDIENITHSTCTPGYSVCPNNPCKRGNPEMRLSNPQPNLGNPLTYTGNPGANPCNPQVCPGKPRNPQVCPGNPGNPQVCPGNPGNPQVCPGNPGNPQVCPGNPGNPQVCPGNPGNPQVCPGKPRNPQVCPGNPGNPQVCPGNPGNPQVCPGNPGNSQVCPGNIDNPQVRQSYSVNPQVCPDNPSSNPCPMNNPDCAIKIVSRPKDNSVCPLNVQQNTANIPSTANVQGTSKISQITTSKVSNTVPQEYISPMVKALTIASDIPFNTVSVEIKSKEYGKPQSTQEIVQTQTAATIATASMQTKQEIRQETSAIQGSKIIQEARTTHESQALQDSRTTQEKSMQNVRATQTIKTESKQEARFPHVVAPAATSPLTSALTVAPSKPFTPIPQITMDPVPLPPETTPYFPPEIPLAVEPKMQKQVVTCKSPFVEALTTAPDRPYTPLIGMGEQTEAPDFMKDVPPPSRQKITMLSALTTASDRSFTPALSVGSIEDILLKPPELPKQHKVVPTPPPMPLTVKPASHTSPSAFRPIGNGTFKPVTQTYVPQVSEIPKGITSFPPVSQELKSSYAPSTGFRSQAISQQQQQYVHQQQQQQQLQQQQQYVQQQQQYVHQQQLHQQQQYVQQQQQQYVQQQQQQYVQQNLQQEQQYIQQQQQLQQQQHQQQQLQQQQLFEQQQLQQQQQYVQQLQHRKQYEEQQSSQMISQSRENIQQTRKESLKKDSFGLRAATSIPEYQKNLKRKDSGPGFVPQIQPPTQPIQIPVRTLQSHIQPVQKPITLLQPQIQTPIQPIQKPVTMLQPGQYQPNNHLQTFQPVVDENQKPYMRSSSPILRAVSPSMINKPAPSIPYYQADLVAHECAAVETNLYDPRSPAISRSPSPCPGARSTSPFPRTMAKSPAQGPPPNPLKSRFPTQQPVRNEKYLEAKQNLTSYIPKYQTRVDQIKSQLTVDQGGRTQQISGQSQMSSAQSQNVTGQSKFLDGKAQVATQSQSYQNLQLAHTERQQQNQAYKMSEIENVRHLEQLNKSQLQSVETSADNRVQIQRTKRCTEEYERTQKERTIEIQRTGGQTQIRQTVGGTPSVGFQRQTSLTQPAPTYSKIPAKPVTPAANARSYSLPGAVPVGPKQFKPSPLAATTPKVPVGSQSASRPNVPQPYAGGAGAGAGGVTGRQSGAIGVAPKRGRGILNLASAPGSRVPLCGHCNMHIRGPFITALGKIWCPEHFICTTPTCKRPLQDMGFVEERGQLYCEYCFEQYLAPICSKCNSKIKGDCLNAIGKHFHPECFNCAYCNKLFGNSPFFLEDGLPYCEADWNELFTTKCFACGFPVEAGDRWVEALNNNYHSQCFNCTMCKKNLEGQSFYAKGGRPFCKNHAR